MEDGWHRVYINHDPLMIVSPDGLLSHKSAINTHGPYIPHALEIKCPTPQPYKTPVKYSVPDRYIFHFMAEMRALDVNELLYLSWSPEVPQCTKCTMMNPCGARSVAK